MSHHVYLTPYVGIGTDADPLRPDVEPGSAWFASDLSPPRSRHGYALVAVEARQDHPRRLYLAEGRCRYRPLLARHPSAASVPPIRSSVTGSGVASSGAPGSSGFHTHRSTVVRVSPPPTSVW